MIAVGGIENDQRRNFLVGVRFDRPCGELLCWAIAQVARPGDHVVAVSVCKNRDDASKQQLLLVNHLESYKGLCDIKKVNLIGYVLIGNSIRKGLVKEAKSRGAVAVVVGTDKQTAFGDWSSVAKYCSKHLPSSTEVLSIHNGKVVFKRKTCSSSYHSIRGLTKLTKPSFLKTGLKKSSSSMSDILSEYSESQVSESGIRSKPRESLVDNCKIVPYVRSASLTPPTERCLERRPGWPLLRKASQEPLPTMIGLEARKMSVVQWAMSLPNRSPSETPYTGSSPNLTSFSEPESPFSLRRGISDISVDSRRNSHFLWSDIPEEPAGITFEVGLSSDFTWFSYEVLKSSTSHFSSENLIGKGGCSQVYKGIFPDERPVAVKVKRWSKEAWKDFSQEIEVISALKHENITPLLGVCIENCKLISVYEFASKGSLEEFLHDTTKKEKVTWEVRFNVAVRIAEALNYLHTGCSRTVIHRDVKSSNILLSDKFQPKLSDFGLAIWGSTMSSSHTCEEVVGTFGYLAPEYFMYGKVSSKVDVYSFGVVLLELLSGKKPIDSSKEQECLVLWAKNILESGLIRGILDPKLVEEEIIVDEDQMQRMILAATLCLTRSPRLRPHMNEILKLLRGEECLEKWTNSYKQVDEEEEGYNDEAFDSNNNEAYRDTNLRLQLRSLPLKMDDDCTLSRSSTEQSNSSTSLEDYLRGRWSRSSSLE